MDEMTARTLAIAYLTATPRAAVEIYGELRRLYGYRGRGRAPARRTLYADCYDLLWPLLLDSPTVAARVRRELAVILAADEVGAGNQQDIRRIRHG